MTRDVAQALLPASSALMPTLSLWWAMHQFAKASRARPSAVAFRGAGNLACRPAFKQPLESGHLRSGGGTWFSLSSEAHAKHASGDWQLAHAKHALNKGFSLGLGFGRLWHAVGRPVWGKLATCGRLAIGPTGTS